jgi:hypothetical protein
MNVSQPVGMRSATHVFLLLTVATLQCANPPVDNRLFLRSFLSISIWSRLLAAPTSTRRTASSTKPLRQWTRSAPPALGAAGKGGLPSSRDRGAAPSAGGAS